METKIIDYRILNIVLGFENKVIGSIGIYFSLKGWSFPSYEVELVGTEGCIRTQQSVYEGMLFTKDENLNLTADEYY